MAHQNSPAPPQSSSQDTESSLVLRLRSRKFIGEDAVAAIHGRRLPLHLGRPLVRLCVVRGIRHHLDFATGDGAVLKGLLPMFTTAINARLIMSDQIPEMKSAEEMPYCIWYPDLPSEETLRQLAARYPDMRYQVGRTCAIAGYTALYRSLDILPEVAIAEEARESGSLEIFEHIKEPLKWKVFDDYTGTLSTPTPSRLNGDTKICNELKYRQGFEKPQGRADGEEGDSDSDDSFLEDDWFWLYADPYGYNRVGQNVTGDHGLDAPDSWAEMATFRANLPGFSSPVSQTVLDLLSNPLPADLPTCNKNDLIVMAAYRGDLDRYCRLRRPYLVPLEFAAIIRGIFARFIMNDDISWALKVYKGGFDQWEPSHPYQIFYPDVAYPSTYEALARAVPAMRPAVVRAAIYADYKALFDLVVRGPNDEFETVTPDYFLYVEALQSPEPYYRETLESIAREKGILGAIKKPPPYDLNRLWRASSLRGSSVHSTHNILHAGIYSGREIEADCEKWETSIYDGVHCNAIGLERYLSLPDEWLPTKKDVDQDTGERQLDYKTWPPNIAELLGGAD